MIGPDFPVVLGAAARGDEEAFGRLWRDLQPRLLRYFMVAAPAVAEDLASETWLGYPRPRPLRGQRTVVPGLGVHHRPPRGARLAPARGSAADRGHAERPASQPGRAGRPRGDRRRGALHPGGAGLVSHSPADQAEAIVLRVVAGLGVNRVASIMGKRPGTVRVLTHRGLRRLADRLGADRLWGVV